MAQNNVLDTETIERVHKVGKVTSEYLSLLANEPSIGLHHVCEHIRRSVPKVVETKRDMVQKSEQLEEAILDTQYSIETLESIRDLQSFDRTSSLLQSSLQSLAILYRDGTGIQRTPKRYSHADGISSASSTPIHHSNPSTPIHNSSVHSAPSTPYKPPLSPPNLTESKSNSFSSLVPKEF